MKSRRTLQRDAGVERDNSRRSSLNKDIGDKSKLTSRVLISGAFRIVFRLGS